MSYSNEIGTHTYSGAGWDDESDWGQNDIDTTVIDRDFIDYNYQTYNQCSNALRDSTERHEVVSEYAWDSDENSVCDADLEEVHSEYAWDADEICSVYAWEAEELSDCDSEDNETRCSWASAAKHASQMDEVSSVYAWEEQEDLSDWDSEEDETCYSWASAAKPASEANETCSVYAWDEQEDVSDRDFKVERVSWDFAAKLASESDHVCSFMEYDSVDVSKLFNMEPAVIRGTPRSADGKKMFKIYLPKAPKKDVADESGTDTPSYCENGCCTSPECQQNPPSSKSNTAFLDDVDCEDADEEAQSEYAVDFSSKETSSFCERGCCAVPEYDTDTAKINDNTEVTSTPNIAKLSDTADTLGLKPPTYCENECCEGSECQRYPSSPEDNDNFLDENSNADTSVDETLTEGESYFGFRMRSDKLKFCTDVRSLHGHFRKIDNDGFEFTDLAGNKINVYFYNDTLHAVQQDYTTWFNFEHLPPVVANTLCAARAAINAVFGY